MTDCIFCKIVAAEIPASIVYEDEDILAFLDIAPTNQGHTLVIPKLHVRNVFDATPETLGKMVTAGQKIARGMQEALSVDGVTLVMNNEPAGGQEVFHAHLHVIPRFEDDSIFVKPKHTTYEGEEMSMVATKIKNAIV